MVSSKLDGNGFTFRWSRISLTPVGWHKRGVIYWRCLMVYSFFV
jgi:hypothetical protein